MPIQSIEPRRLYRQIADQIRTLIGSGEYPLGARLPPERDLARQLGVSRPSVREALIALEVEGLVEVRIGSGIYVQGLGRGEAVGHETHATAGPFEQLRARWVIESECAALAARSRKKTQLAAIEGALEQMQQALDNDQQPVSADRLFHVRIAEATGNGALVQVVRMLWEDRSGPLYRRLDHHYAAPKLWVAAMNEHRSVVKAIAERDAGAARKAMQQHVNHAYKRFSTGWDAVSRTTPKAKSALVATL